MSIFSKKFKPVRWSKEMSVSQNIADSSSKKTSLLKDNSWIRHSMEEEGLVDLPSEAGQPSSSTASPSTSVNDLTKRFSGSQELVSTSSPPHPPKPKTVSSVLSTTSTSMKDSKTAKSPGSISLNPPKPPTSSSRKSPSMSLFTARVFSSPKKLFYSPPNPPEVLTHAITHITDEEPPAVSTTPPPPPMIESPTSQASINEVSLETGLPDPPSLTPTQTLLSIPNRSVTEGLCSYCCEPMMAGAKMILEDLQIYSHSSCFKCEVCHCPLGDLHAGDSMWLHRGTVHCVGCFSTTRELYLL